MPRRTGLVQPSIVAARRFPACLGGDWHPSISATCSKAPAGGRTN